MGSVIDVVAEIVSSVFDFGGDETAPVAPPPQILQAPDPKPVAPQITPPASDRTAKIKGAEDDATKKKKAARVGRKSLVQGLTPPTGLGLGTQGDTATTSGTLGTGV